MLLFSEIVRVCSSRVTFRLFFLLLFLAYYIQARILLGALVGIV